MSQQNRPIVATDKGRVHGAVEGAVASFRGVPYAASPVGKLRFAPPQPHPAWSGVREAVQAGPAVPQGPSRLELVMGNRKQSWDEDGSLTLNVWSPQHVLDGNASLPVLVWFHGGGFTSGSGGWDWYDGARLAALGNMVVVTANYRVGSLGNLRLPDIGADNLGAQDQGAVLRWVRDNIAAFGGDPETVTVGGQSAGAFSAFQLAVDPETGRMIRRVIAESGPWGLEPQDPELATENTKSYLRLLGLEDSADLTHALRQVRVEELLAAYSKLMVDKAEFGVVAPPMYPVLGGSGMPYAWRQALDAGALAGKDLLIGSTRDEMTAFFAFDERIQTLTREEALNFLVSLHGGEAQALYERHEAQCPDATPAQVVTDVETEAVFQGGVIEIATHHAAGGNNAYVYQWDFRPEPDVASLGATHCGELPFLFGTFDSYPDSPMLGRIGARTEALWRSFAGALASFVTTGSPNGEGLTSWQPYVAGSNSQVLHFG
ncbi:carboxylesterase/lipase family protein [Streptomyces sp. NPDC007896]|uniref:carboxylesterase/lipase family protein n=1 Tax=Streptomyces sp. NPDC007896 TaxID=3364784 RepID=UPI0036E2F444